MRRYTSAMRKIVLLFTTLLLGCASPLKIDQFGSLPISGITEIVLLNNNQFNSKVRRALTRHGFKVKARPSVVEITQKSDDIDVTYRLAEADYGIRHQGRLSGNNPCMTNGNAFHFTEYEYELVDLSTNETLLFISKGGWTDWCTGSPTIETTDLFGDLAKELAGLIQPRNN